MALWVGTGWEAQEGRAFAPQTRVLVEFSITSALSGLHFLPLSSLQRRELCQSVQDPVSSSPYIPALGVSHMSPVDRGTPFPQCEAMKP